VKRSRPIIALSRNFFCPVMKHLRTESKGSCKRRIYDQPASIHNHSARKQNLSQQPPFRAIRARFVHAVERPVNWKSVLIELIPKNESYRHQKP
jgi:hypothetical protein